MLEITRASRFLPGINLKGQVAGANWVFLRPCIQAEHVACVGVPAPASIATLARFSAHVLIIVPPWQVAPRAAVYAQWPNVSIAEFRRGTTLPYEALRVDTLCVVDSAADWWLRVDGRLQAEVCRVLRPDAIVYGERYRFTPPVAASDPAGFALSPLRGELHVAVPAASASNAAFGRMAREARSPRPSRIGRVVQRIAARVPAPGFIKPSWSGVSWPFRSRLNRVATLSGPAMRSDQPPDYLRTIAAQSGVDLTGFSWAFLARGDYPSRKLLFFLTDPHGDRQPTYIAKMVREPAFNARLENEHRVLQWVHATGGIDPRTIPRPVFHGQHSGLTVVGETVVNGAPMLSRSSGTADCPYFRNAMLWLSDLGAIPAARGAAMHPELEDVLGQLLSQFEALFAPPPSERQFLRAQLERLAEVTDGVPLVVQHGDPGVWNILALADGGVAVLDWEAAELDGLPLWDVFYFLRTYAVAADRRHGGRSAAEAVRRQLLSPTPLSAAAAVAIQRYCERIDVPAAAVEPLFYMCWVHRALKEATRLPPGRLDRSRFTALLRLLIQSGDTPALGRLLQR